MKCITLNRRGIWFPFEGDRICRSWFWKRDTNVYYSEKFNRSFYSLADYLKYIGSLGPTMGSSSMSGLNYGDILPEWVSYKFPKEIIVVLTDINTGKKTLDFWNKVPHPNREVFGKDIVILYCKDLGQLKRIIDSIDISFADAYGFKNGELVYWNE